VTSQEQLLLDNIKAKLPELRSLLDAVNDEWGYEDAIYRFYHGSYKVYGAQGLTRDIVKALHELLPDVPMNATFLEIVAAGTNQKFTLERSNQNWLEETRPIIEALSHAKFMLEMCVKYGTEYEEPPQLLDSGWALFLYLYNMR
jgi:hypothetical protein